MAKKGVFEAAVTANRRIGEGFYRLGLEFSRAGAEAFAECAPGQFAELDLSAAALPKQKDIPEKFADASRREILLRRPFSFCDVTAEGEKTIAEILYCALGPASLRMTTLAQGDSVSVMGPLGNGFGVPDGTRQALLVTGGMGAGPLEYLAKMLGSNHPEIKVTAFVGAKTVKALPFENAAGQNGRKRGKWPGEFAKYGAESIVATDDGSAGYEGFVTDCFREWLSESKLAAERTVIYSCGPEMMLEQMAEIAAKSRIDCQVSTERRMACGIGVCQSCVVECKGQKPGETVYKLCCKDGPVFNASELALKIKN